MNLINSLSVMVSVGGVLQGNISGTVMFGRITDMNNNFNCAANISINVNFHPLT